MPQPGVAVQTCNPSTQKLRQKDFKLKASVGHTARPCVKG